MVDLATNTIMGFEGFRSHAYWDVNHWRVGYGSDTWVDSNGQVHNVTQNTVVTPQQAAADLANRVQQTQQAVIGQVGQSAWNALGQGAQAALTSFAYNYGSLTPSVVSAAQSGDTTALSNAIAARGMDNGGVNSNRRSAEAALALNALPPASIPGSTAYDPNYQQNYQASMATNPLPAPPPLVPPSSTLSGALGAVGSAATGSGAYGNPASDLGYRDAWSTSYDPSAPHPLDTTPMIGGPVVGLPPPNLPMTLPWYSAAPSVPTGGSVLDSYVPGSAPTIPPIPAPTASWQTPTAPASTAGLVKLPSGKMIAPGTYPSTSNPGTTISIADDGSGNAVITQNNPGFAGGVGPGTVAGGYVGKALSGAYQKAAPQVEQTLSGMAGNAQTALGGAASSAQSTLNGALSGLGSFLGLGGQGVPSVPKPPASYSSSQPSASPGTNYGDYGVGSNYASTPTPPPTGGSVLDSYVPTPPSVPTAAPTTKTISVANPAYDAWYAQYGNQGNTAGMTVNGTTVTGTSPTTVSSKFDGTDSMLMGSAPATGLAAGGVSAVGAIPTAPIIPLAPPKFIAKTVQIGTPPGTQLNLAPPRPIRIPTDPNNQLPEAAAAFANGQTTYNYGGVAPLPTVAMNGNQRNTYGDAGLAYDFSHGASSSGSAPPPLAMLQGMLASGRMTQAQYDRQFASGHYTLPHGPTQPAWNDPAGQRLPSLPFPTPMAPQLTRRTLPAFS